MDSVWILLGLFNLNMLICDFKERKVRHIIRFMGLAIALYAVAFYPVYAVEFVLTAVGLTVLFYLKAIGGGDNTFAINALVIPYAGAAMLSGVLLAALHSKVTEGNFSKAQGQPLAAYSVMILVVILCLKIIYAIQ